MLKRLCQTNNSERKKCQILITLLKHNFLSSPNYEIRTPQTISYKGQNELLYISNFEDRG